VGSDGMTRSLQHSRLQPIFHAMTRRTLPCLAALIATFACLGVAPLAEANPRLSRTERGVIRLINQFRAENGLGAVRASPALNRAAEQHSRDMLASDFFDHPSSDGTPFDRRVRRYANASAIGETLAAMSQPRGGAGLVVQMWKDSPPHRAILLTGSFTRVGLSRLRGMLGSSRETVVTADFASG
jgi:uncharacterized protein YkwD